MQNRSFLNKCFYDKNNKLTIAQAPNKWIVSALLFITLGRLNFLSDYKFTIDMLASATLVIWAGLEITSGANYFRRLLGTIVLTLVIINLVLRFTT